MAHALWKGSISFGLVHIPVALGSAASDEELHFRLLDRRNFQPIRFRRVNDETGEEVPQEEIVKGYEHAKGDFVVLSEADFRRANVEATQTIEIVDFVEPQEIEPTYYRTPYYVTPLKNGRKGYLLLREALRRTGQVGIARVVIRTRQHLAMLAPMGNVLVLELLRYEYELRDTKGLDVPGADLEEEGVTEREMKLAERLVEGMAGEWKPGKYKDEYREDLLALIEKKVAAGQTRTIDDSEPETKRPAAPRPVDLMLLLQQSVAAAGQGKTQRQAAASRSRRPVRKSA